MMCDGVNEPAWLALRSKSTRRLVRIPHRPDADRDINLNAVHLPIATGSLIRNVMRIAVYDSF